MTVSLLLLLGGLILLTAGADRFVVSASRISAVLGLSPILIGALVIGLGTSAPEMLVSGLAAARGEIDPAVCVKVWETPPYPDYNWTAHPALEEAFGAGFIDRLQAALVGMNDPALLADAQRKEGIIEASNEDFTPLAELARELDLLR